MGKLGNVSAAFVQVWLADELFLSKHPSEILLFSVLSIIIGFVIGDGSGE